MNAKLVQAVAITASLTFLIAAALFYLLYRRLRMSRPVSSFRTIKGVIVDEEGLDVLYMRKLEAGHFSRCVWYYNPMVGEVSKRVVDGMPVQEMPLLSQESCRARNGQETDGRKSLGFLSMVEVDASKTSQKHAHAPPPPPPPPQKGNVKLGPPSKPKPAPPPPPGKKNETSSLRRPPTIPRRDSNSRLVREESSDKEMSKENGRKVKLKPLHWEKVSTHNADHSMVWNEINDGSFKVDDDMMEALFGYQNSSSQNTEKFSTRTSSSLVQPPHIFLLDPQKSQNTAIILKSLAISQKEILDSLIHIQNGLNTDTLEKLTKISPTQEEINKILRFDGDSTRLAYAESFLYCILKVVPSAFIHFNAMLFRSTYDSEILHLKNLLQTLELGCKELRRGGIFFKLLEAILKAGNRMNAGTNRGNAQGFNLTTLRRLSDVRSTNGKTTLLHFVVDQVVRLEGKRCLINCDDRARSALMNINDHNNPNEERDLYLELGLPVVETLNTDLANVIKAANIDHGNLIAICPILMARVNEIKQDLIRCDAVESSGRFVREMKRFLEECQEELTVVREEEKRVMEGVRKTTVYFQAGCCSSKDSKEGNPLQLFSIVKDFLKCVDRVCAEVNMKLQKKAATVKTSGSGSSPLPSPPLSPNVRSPVRFSNLELYFGARRIGTSSSDLESEDEFDESLIE